MNAAGRLDTALTALHLVLATDPGKAREYAALLDARTGCAEWRQTVKLPPAWKLENLGIAALVQDVWAGEVLQVVSMPGCA